LPFKRNLQRYTSGDTITAADAVRIMVEECVLPRAAQVYTHAGDVLGDVIATSEVLRALASHKPALRQIFRFYSHVEELVGRVALTRGPGYFIGYSRLVHGHTGYHA
jgi:hypothetical protein